MKATSRSSLRIMIMAVIRAMGTFPDMRMLHIPISTVPHAAQGHVLMFR